MIEAFSSLLKWPLAFDEEKHVYTLNGEKIPSVTQVLRELNGFPEQDEGFVSEAAEFGTEVHKAVAATLMKKKIIRIDERIPPYVKAAKKFVKEFKLSRTSVYVEQRGFDPLLRFAGTIDSVFVGPGDNRFTIVDWKTGSYRPGYALQLAGYARILGEGICNCYCVMLSPDGEYEARGGRMLISSQDESSFKEFVTELSHYNLMRKYGRCK